MESYERADNKVGNGGILVLEPRSKGVAPAFTHTTGFECLEATSTSTLKVVQSLPAFRNVDALTPVMRLTVPWVCSWAIMSLERLPSRAMTLCIQTYILISGAVPSGGVAKLARTASAGVHPTIDFRY